MALTTITVTGSYPAGAGSSAATGFVTFVPTARIVNAAGHTIIPQLPIQVQLQLGAFSLPNVVTTDNAGLSPAGWAWEVTENISGVQAEPYYVYIPATFGATVDLAQITEATPGPIITAYANLQAANTFTNLNTFADGLTVAGGFELDGTAIATPSGGDTAYLNADGAWTVPAGGAGGGGITPPAGDIGGTTETPTVLSTHLTDPLPTGQGGTGAASLTAAGILQAANNLSDLASEPAARTSLGLGGAAVLNVGTGSGTVAAGNDTRITGALQSSNNLGDVASASGARSNLGLGSASTQASSAFDAAGAAAIAQATAETFATSAVGAETARAESAEALLAPLASPALTGTPTAPTKTPLTSNTDIATTAYADAAVTVETTRAQSAEASKAPLASPALTGSPTAPTQTTGDNSTKVATDAFVTTAVATETTRAETAEAALLLASNNLSDVASAATSRTNLGLGSAAVLASSAVAQTANNLSDLASEATARTNLGLGSAALLASSAVALTANNLSDLANETTARTNLGLGSAATASLPLALTSGGTGLSSAPAAASESLLATSTGAVAWSTQTYNIVAYGADPTGAADSTTAINNAITAAVAAGGTVLIPPGTFSTTGIVINGASKFCIRADRGATLWIAAPTTGAPTQVTRNILTLIGCSDFAIENLTIDGRRDTIAPITVLAANAASGQASVQVANGAAAAYKVGQVLNVCGGWTVASGAQQNFQDQNLTIASITPGGGTDTITFTANLANAYTSAAGTQTDGYGPIAGNGGYITPWQTGAATIAGRVLTQEDQQNGVHLIACTRFRISGCEITGMWESGIRLGDHLLNGSAQNDGCTLGTITGNIVTHCYDQGIGLWCSSNVTVTGNTITAAGWAGICMTGSDQCAVTGNVSSNNAQLIPGGAGGYGAAIEGGLGNVVAANQFNNNQYTPVLLTALGTIPFGGPVQAATSVASGSNGVALPATVVNLTSATGLATAGQITILSSAGAQQVTYTGISGSQLTGCSGGVGTLYTGQRVTQYPVFTNNGATLPIGSTSTVVSNGALFQVGGKYSVVDGPRTERITVTAVSTNTLSLQYPTAFQHSDQCQISQAVAESNQILGNSCSGGIDAGIKLASAIRTTIDNNLIYQVGLRGIDGIIWAAGGVQPPYGTIVTNNTITAPDSTGNGAAYSSIAFAQCSDLQISGNRCGGALSSTQESYVALFVQAITDSIISRNIVADTYGVGMRLDAVNEWVCKRVTVAENQLLRTGGEGLVLYGGQELQVTGNILEGCAPNSGGGYGGALDVRGVQNSVIANNLVMNNGHGGISLDSGSINGTTVYTSANTFTKNISADDGLNYDCWTGTHQQQGSGIKEVSASQGPNTYDGNLTFGTTANFSLTSIGNTFTGIALVPTPVQTGTYNPVPGDFVLCNTAGGALTVPLPTAPADRTTIGGKIVTLGAGHAVTFTTGGADVFNVAGGATSFSISLLFQGVIFQYQASAAVWVVLSDDLPLGQLDARYVLQSGLPLAIASGGTGSATKNFVDLTTGQTIAGVKAFSSPPTGPTPVGSTDLVNKAYADAIAVGLSIKASVQEATAAALPTNIYANGASGVGATLTGVATGVLTIDGVTVALGDRVLVQNEAAGANNGLYSCTTAGATGVAYVLTRTTDMNTASQVPGAFTFVEQGTVNAGAGFVVASEGPFTIGTTAIAWTQFSGAGEITAGTGLTKTGNTLALTAPVSIANGGTGKTLASGAFNALSPITALGDTIYGSATNTSSRLPGNASATKEFLTQTGTGSASAAPAWGAIAAADVPGVAGITVTGTPTSGQALVATSGAAADWQSAGAAVALTQFGTASTNGATGQYSDAGHVHGAPDAYSWDSPKQHGFREWLFPLTMPYLNQSFTSGTIYGATFIAQTNSSVSKIAAHVTSSAATPTAGENLIGLYTVSGTTWTQVTVTGDLGTWGSTGLNEYALGAAQTLVPGTTYMLLFLSVATTAVHLGGFGGNNNFTNLGCSSTASPWVRFFTYGTGQTALPSSFTASTSTLSIASAIFPWAGLL